MTILSLAAAPLLAGCLEASSTSSIAEPYPLDPLSPAEQDRAVALALADEGVQRALAGKHRVIGAALHVEKYAVLAGDHTRYADVHVYHYPTDSTVWPVVDLTNGKVARFTIEKFQPALTPDEILEAQALAFADARVAAKLGSTDGVTTIGILKGDESPLNPCYAHRCLEISFLRGAEPVNGLFARVDLTTELVESVWGDLAASAPAKAVI